MSKRVLVAIALGANLGDRGAHLAYAVSRLTPHLSDISVSSWHETLPVDTPDPQPLYLNGALVGRTSLDPHALLDLLLAIERERGRERHYVNAPRTLDLDLLFYADLVLSDDRLTVPHPRLRERMFVLAPLAEIAPDLRDPQTGLTVAGLLARLDRTR